MKKQIFLRFVIIVLSLLGGFIIICTRKKKEPFATTNKPVIVLVGDSLLRNNSYVPYGESVSDWLQQKQKKCLTIATDGAMIRDVYTQLKDIPPQLNAPTTTLVISVGGNDFLRNLHKYTPEHKHTQEDEEKTFEAYISLLEMIQGKWNRTKIILLSLFCPETQPNMCFLVSKWNNMQSRYANSKNIQIIPMDSSYKQLDHGIEPTSEGGKQIAEQIIAFLEES